MDLQAEVAGVFAPGAALDRALPGFKSRAGQERMAQAVARTVEVGGTLVVEAGTGVGKTYAYLVPVLLSGRRALISTATKALQDQLALRDIPRLQTALGAHARVAILKGRSSYLCLNRLATARQALVSPSSTHGMELARVERWASATQRGDLAEIPELSDQTPVLPLVTSTRDNCLGGTCPQAGQCFVNLARSTAMAADIVVVNHHLFFADRNVRESGVAELLPGTDVVVLDEAHQLNDIGVQFAGRQLSTRQLEDLTRELFKHAAVLTLGSAHWRTWVAAMESASAALRAGYDVAGTSTRLNWLEPAPEGLTCADWTAAIDGLHNALSGVASLLAHLADASAEIAQLGLRAERYLQDLTYFRGSVQPGYHRWLEVGQHLKMYSAPLDISQSMQGYMDTGDNAEVARKAWIFTSATLGTDPQLELFRSSCGLNNAEVLQVESPFDYMQQACLYVPESFPLPSDPMHSVEVAHLAAKAARLLGGRTLVLTTTLRAMQAIGQAMRADFAVVPGVTVLVQGEASKREILERFCTAGASGAPGLAVVAAASFWEGVDIPGDALQLVIIDKIPFTPPDHPLTQARADQLTVAGKNAFRSLHLPEAALGLKQGAGRLIRSELDRGVLVIADVRLVRKAYGKKLLAALPAMRHLEDAGQFHNELTNITTLSTTDLCWT